jgi:hypothetical protein
VNYEDTIVPGHSDDDSVPWCLEAHEPNECDCLVRYTGLTPQEAQRIALAQDLDEYQRTHGPIHPKEPK